MVSHSKMLSGEDTRPYSEQYVATMKRVWAWLDANYNASLIWGDSGNQLVSWHAAMRCHGHLPIACAFLALASAASNGALTFLFGDDLTPLFVWFLNNNYPQTRKTEITKVLSQGAAELDRLIKENFMERWRQRRAAINGQRERAGLPPLTVPEPVIHTIEIPNMTPSEMFVRLAGDWMMVSNAVECLAEEWKLTEGGRLHFSNLVNDDEFYQKATDFRLITGDAKKLTEVCEHQSTLNRLVTMGDVKRATKSAGSSGMTSTAKVSLGGVSNIHPALACPLQRHDVGQHVVACIERFAMVTQHPVQPHEPLPDSLQLPDEVARGTWIRLLPRVVNELNLADVLANPSALEKLESEKVTVPFTCSGTHTTPDDNAYYVLELPDQTALPLVFKNGAPSFVLGTAGLQNTSLTSIVSSPLFGAFTTSSSSARTQTFNGVRKREIHLTASVLPKMSRPGVNGWCSTIQKGPERSELLLCASACLPLCWRSLTSARPLHRRSSRQRSRHTTTSCVCLRQKNTATLKFLALQCLSQQCLRITSNEHTSYTFFCQAYAFSLCRSVTTHKTKAVLRPICSWRLMLTRRGSSFVPGFLMCWTRKCSRSLF